RPPICHAAGSLDLHPDDDAGGQPDLPGHLHPEVRLRRHAEAQGLGEGLRRADPGDAEIPRAALTLRATGATRTRTARDPTVLHTNRTIDRLSGAPAEVEDRIEGRREIASPPGGDRRRGVGRPPRGLSCQSDSAAPPTDTLVRR